MCIELPGRIVELDDGRAVVEREGSQVRASTLVVPDVAVGDWVVVLAGTIIDRLTANEAAEIRGTLLAATAPDRAGTAIPVPKGGA